MIKCLSYLGERNLIPSENGDKILLQFKEFLNKEVKCSLSDFKTFNHKENRLDAFSQYFSVDKEKYNKLRSIVKIILILSHGPATVERGFSLNKVLEIENLKERSYIAQRLIVEAVIEAGDVLDVSITKDMRQSVQCARQKYLNFLDSQKKERMEEQSHNKRKKLIEEINFLQAKRKCFEEDVKNMHQSSDALADEGEKKKDISLFLKSNLHRKEAIEKNFELESMKETLKDMKN